MTVDLPVLGMTCAACVRRVERAIGAVPGVTSAEVNLVLSRARIVGEVDPIAAVAAIREAGYEVPADALAPAGPRRMAAIDRARADETRGLRRDAIVAIVLAIPLVAIAMAWRSPSSAIVQLVLGTLIVFGPGRRYLIGGARAVAHRSPDMNTLIALGVGTAWVVSVVHWIVGTGELYVEAAGAIVAFVMLGKLLEARARSRLADAVRGLIELAPTRARIVVDDAEREVEAASLAAGDVLAVRPGERLAADGTVVKGAAAIDESLLTGESLPVDKAEGSPVYAGTLAHGALEVRVARAGDATALARIARSVEDAQGDKAAIAALADRVSAVFVPIVLAIGAATFVGWLMAGAASDAALERAIAVLVIACPCALGLATPAAVAVGTARAAELGILFRGGRALEAASSIHRIALDKTGTLTTGHPTLTDVIALDGEATLLAHAGSAELASEHPIARAIVDGARARGVTLVRPDALTATPGGGVVATLGAVVVHVGSRDHVAAVCDPTPLDARATALAAAGRTVCYVAVDRALAGLVAVADPPSADARATIAALRAMDVEPIMITGDREGAARWIADAVGIAVIHHDVRPLAKAALVGGGGIAFVGDGINDAPALATAALGIALASGTDLAASASDVTILRGGLAGVPVALALARATLHVIRRNLYAAFAYNAICIPIAAAGWLSPMVASAAMSLSSVSVLLSSLQLKRWQP